MASDVKRSQIRVLVVDDDEHVRAALHLMLDRGGLFVTSVGTGDEALQHAQDSRYDVAVVDFDMNGMNGVEVLEALRHVQPTCVRMLLTGRLELSTALDAVNRGEIARALQKPIHYDELHNAISNAVEHQDRMLDALQRAVRSSAQAERAEALECLEGGHLRLAVQPILRAGGREVVAYEALLRSTHPKLDGPATVLRAVENHGLVHELADEVAKLAIGWLTQLPSSTRLFVNVHPLELADPVSLAGRLALLRPWASRVVLEITERSQFDAMHGWEASVQQIMDAGFAIAVDDLGAGYSSLSVLAELQPAFIKIDMSIIRDVDRTPRKQRLVDLLVLFAEATDAIIVAEGVETEAEAATLELCGAHFLQGYLFGRPSLTLATPNEFRRTG